MASATAKALIYPCPSGLPEILAAANIVIAWPHFWGEGCQEALFVISRTPPGNPTTILEQLVPEQQDRSSGKACNGQ